MTRWKGAKTAKELHDLGGRYFNTQDAEEIFAIFEGSKGIIAHNAVHDIRVLQDQFIKVGAVKLVEKKWPQVYCTQQIASDYWGFKGRRSALVICWARTFAGVYRDKGYIHPLFLYFNHELAWCEKWWNETFGKAHEAKNDAMATAELFMFWKWKQVP